MAESWDSTILHVTRERNNEILSMGTFTFEDRLIQLLVISSTKRELEGINITLTESAVGCGGVSDIAASCREDTSILEILFYVIKVIVFTCAYIRSTLPITDYSSAGSRVSMHISVYVRR